MPLKKFNQLQDKFFEVSKKMHESASVHEKTSLLNELRRILKDSKAALDEIHQKTPPTGK